MANRSISGDGGALSFAQGVKDALPICFGYLSVSLAFGMIAAGKGMPAWAAELFAVTCVSGTGQFVGVNLMSAGAALIELLCTLAVINARYLLMSVSLSQKLPMSLNLWQRLIVAYGNTDEIFAMASTQTRPLTFGYMCGMIFISVSGWLAGTLIGELAGGVIPQSVMNAMNIALYAMYIALIIPDARKSAPVAVVTAAAAALSCLITYIPFTSGIGSGWTIIIAGVTAAVAGALLFPRDVETSEDRQE
ncbi:MAG: AzlC family ABC transporter permease [Clostridiales bacterium]|nr:AzlC family ABC transporter permease [Clostridiales bacterium]